jgi:hypothetical protein
MDFDYPYQLDKEEARARLGRLGQYLQNRHGIAVSWNGDRGHFSGKYLVVHIDGELILDDGVVHVSGKDPGFLWRKRASDYLKRKLASYLDPSVATDQLPIGK